MYIDDLCQRKYWGQRGELGWRQAEEGMGHDWVRANLSVSKKDPEKPPTLVSH